MNFLWTGAGSSAGTPVEMYLIIFALLLVCELVYFRIADKCNIIDKPNERSSHSTVVLRGGGIIFLGAVAVLAVAYVLFKKKYYHLHEEYLESIGGCSRDSSLRSE